MAFDFDPFVQLDVNVDGVVDESDLKIWELQQGDPPSLHDLNHDGTLDRLQGLDFNSDTSFDKFQADIDQNSVIDKFEQNHMGTKFAYDLNHDGKTDHIDEALARVLFEK